MVTLPDNPILPEDAESQIKDDPPEQEDEPKKVATSHTMLAANMIVDTHSKVTEAKDPAKPLTNANIQDATDTNLSLIHI